MVIDPAQLWQQWYVSGRAVTLKGFRAHQQGRWHLHAHPALPVMSFDGGWLVGHILGGRAPQSSEQVGDWLKTASGRFVVIVTSPDPRIHLDAAGTLAAVYSSEYRIAASTITLGQMAADRAIAEPSVTDFPNDRPNMYWPAGLTASPAYSRLLPNHVLDLHSWTPVRHNSEMRRPTRPAKEVIAERLTESIAQIVSGFPVTYLPLTAGRDSRCLLAGALAAGVAEKITFVTFDYRNQELQADLERGQHLARRFDLKHLVLPVYSASDDEKRDYLLRIGVSGGWGKVRDFYTAAKACDPAGAWVNGFCGEVGRASYWLADALSSVPSKPSAADVLGRMGLPNRPDFLRAMDTWLAGLPPVDWATALDLAHLEMRVGSWASAHMYGVAPFAAQFMPLGDRRILDAMLSAPLEERQSERLPLEVIKHLSPALGRVPLGRPLHKRVLSRLTRLIRR